jgi:cell wall-associated NlpC family hydrolase
VNAFRLPCLLLLTVLAAGCLHLPGTIADLRTLEQDPRAYVGPGDSPRPLMPADRQAILNRDFDARYFLPWHLERPRYDRTALEELFAQYRRNPGYGENLLPRPADWIRRLEEDADLASFPRSLFRAITLRNTALRTLPTARPHFNDPTLPGEGYPFDNLQMTAVWVNTPVLVTHQTRDGAWVWAEAPFACGWLPREDLAPVDHDFVASWETGSYAAILGDDIPLRDGNGAFRFRAHLGALFPLVADEGSVWRIRLAVADGDGRARLLSGVVAAGDADRKPLAATPSSLARVAGRLAGQNYGWGGMYENRDCSAMVRDLFVPFGLWLPRNSAQQARAGKFISLKELPVEEREKEILAQGVPWLTLIWLRGHIMLYLGERDGRAVVLHNLWGLRTRRPLAGEGRFVIGRAVITTLQPGRELYTLDPEKGDLRSRLEGMTLLVP